MCTSYESEVKCLKEQVCKLENERVFACRGADASDTDGPAPETRDEASALAPAQLSATAATTKEEEDATTQHPASAAEAPALKPGPTIRRIVLPSTAKRHKETGHTKVVDVDPSIVTFVSNSTAPQLQLCSATQLHNMVAAFGLPKQKNKTECVNALLVAVRALTATATGSSSTEDV